MASKRYREHETLTIRAVRKGVKRAIAEGLIDPHMEPLLIDYAVEAQGDEAKAEVLARFTGEREGG